MTATMSGAATIAQESRQQAPVTFLVVGYGDSSHRDEGAGDAVVKAVQRWGVSCIKTITVEQLTPQLIEAMAETEYVLFVSACDNEQPCQPQIVPICFEPGATGSWPQWVDPWTPAQLLRLTQAVYHRCPQAWSLKVPAADFETGTQFSVTAEEGIAHTLDTIAVFLRCYTPIHMPSN